MICKSEMAKLSRIECSFISALVKIVSLSGTVNSDSNNTCLAQRAADFAYVRHLILTTRLKDCSVGGYWTYGKQLGKTFEMCNMSVGENAALLKTLKLSLYANTKASNGEGKCTRVSKSHIYKSY